MPISITEVDGGACACIDLAALRHNLGVVHERAPGRRVMAVIKSQAYGHGMLPVAQALQERVDAFALARIDEAVSLRKAGIDVPLVVLEGPLTADDLGLARRYALTLVIHDLHQLALLQGDMSSGALDCWIKFDTGMHRLGFDPAQAGWLLGQFRALPWLRLAGLMTHLANADDIADATTETQLSRMRLVLPGCGLARSIANSAGILAWPDSHADWVRPGLMLYGASPLIGRDADALDLRSVMTLSVPLLAVHRVSCGEPVGYGGTWRAPEDLSLGVVGIGYGDGYPRHLRRVAKVLLRGHRLPVVGRVSMDMLTVDLRGLPEARVGDRVTLWGDGLPVDEVARWADTIPYTLFCGVTARVTRDYGG